MKTITRLLATAALLFGVVGGVCSVKAGNSYLEITTDEAKTNAWDWQFWFQLSTPLEASTTYVLTMDVKCSQAFHLDFWPHESTSNNCIYTGYDVDTEWKSYKCEFSTGECAADRVRWCFGTLQGKLYFDNICLVKKGETSNILSGSDFETALDAHWSATSGVAYSIYETASTPTRCFKFVNSEAKTEVYQSTVKYDLDNPLESGKKYILTMRAKATEAFSIAFWPAKTGGGTKYTGYNIGTDWTDCSCEFDAEDAYTFLQWCIGNKSNCTVWFDDIALVEKGTSTNLIANGSFDGPMVPNWGDFGYHKPDYYGLEITYPAVEAVAPLAEVQLTKSMFKQWSSHEQDATIVSNTPYWDAYEYGEECSNGAAVYGSPSVNYLDYANISNFSALKIYGTGSKLRVMFNRLTNGGSDYTEVQVTPTVEGTLLDLTSYSYVHLNAIKVVNGGGATTVTNITLIDPNVNPTVNYVFSGDIKDGLYSASAASALEDGNAKVIDVTGVTGSGVNLGSANPNCLFVANAGVLTTPQNVIVSGTCSNLVLTDNYPFKAPSDFTATAATYTTTINTTAQAGTLCLPFAATIPDGVKAWTLAYTSGTSASATPVATTIPANTPVLLNGSGSATFEGTSVAIDADATNVSGALTGVFETTAVPLNSYVLQNGTSGLGFYKVATNDITAKPFRAYLTAQSTSARLSIDFNDGTAIKNVDNVKSEAASIYNLSGQRVEKATKGLYIKNGKKVIIK